MSYIVYENGFFVDRSCFLNYWLEKGLSMSMIDALITVCHGDLTKDNIKRKLEDGSILKCHSIGKAKHKKMRDIITGVIEENSYAKS